MSQDKLSRLHTKDELYAAATAWVEVNIPRNIPLENPVQKQKLTSLTSGAILGKDIMEAIWEDMALTKLPSWVTTVPHNWGTIA
ncbi:hypothetical protein EDB89DRAFT_2071873 [Lactarius sanguifluus]|nr:hypothetical protein EDB89DRAFT_2071873 [Lactarius sanguifluus]